MKAVFKTTGSSSVPVPGKGKDPVREMSVEIAAGETIFQEGDLGTEMYIIQDGEVEISKKLAGSKHVMSRLERGDFFGEMAILEDAPRTADAIALTGVKLLAINGSRFDEMLRKNPEIAVRIIRKYSQRLREANSLLERLAGREFDTEKALSPSSDSTNLGRESARQYRLVDVATGEAFYLADAETTTIGRADPVTGITPDIDLAPVDESRSVSRRHARIVRHGKAFAVLEDVGTVNGTYVNDQRVPTGIPVPIHNGDRLKIGLIQMKVVFDL